MPQELHTDAFETVWATVSFSRGLFGKPKNPAHYRKVLTDLSLWDKKDNKIITLSGGMKRRLMILKMLIAPAADPVSRRADRGRRRRDCARACGKVVRTLQASGVALSSPPITRRGREMADRIGVISRGQSHPGRGQSGPLSSSARSGSKLHLQGRIDANPRRCRGL